MIQIVSVTFGSKWIAKQRRVPQTGAFACTIQCFQLCLGIRQILRRWKPELDSLLSVILILSSILPSHLPTNVVFETRLQCGILRAPSRAAAMGQWINSLQFGCFPLHWMRDAVALSPFFDQDQPAWREKQFGEIRRKTQHFITRQYNCAESWCDEA